LRQRTDADALAILKEAATKPTYKSKQIRESDQYKSILDTLVETK
jgi:hypothetical protein